MKNGQNENGDPLKREQPQTLGPNAWLIDEMFRQFQDCLLYTSPSPRDPE